MYIFKNPPNKCIWWVFVKVGKSKDLAVAGVSLQRNHNVTFLHFLQAKRKAMVTRETVCVLIG